MGSGVFSIEENVCFVPNLPYRCRKANVRFRCHLLMNAQGNDPNSSNGSAFESARKSLVQYRTDLFKTTL